MDAAIAASQQEAQREDQKRQMEKQQVIARQKVEANRRQQQKLHRSDSGGRSRSEDTKEQEIRQYASLLASQPVALDTLLQMMTQIMHNPSEPLFRRVHLTNKAFHAKVGSAPGALDLLRVVGFAPDATSATMTLSPGTEDTALLWLAKSVLETQKETTDYAMAKEQLELLQVLEASKETSMEAVMKRRELLRKRLPREPAEGQGGTAKICFHIGEERVWRRFDADDTLGMVMNFVSCLDEVDPFQSWQLLNATTFPNKILEPKDAQRTLQALELWPSGQIKVQPKFASSS